MLHRHRLDHVETSTSGRGLSRAARSVLAGVLAIATSNVAAGTGCAAQPVGPAPVIQRVRLCASLPFGIAAYGPLARGINNSVILATDRWTARFRAARLLLLPPLRLDDATLDGSHSDPNREKDNARNCVGSREVFGYIGPMTSGMTIVSEPILNRAGMVQISPATTVPNLTSPVVRKVSQPATYRHRLAYLTYYRVITTDFMQGPADAAFLKEKLHVGTFFVVDDTLGYGAGIAGEVQAYGAKIGMRLVGTAHLDPRSPSTIASTSDTASDLIVARHPDAVFYGGDADPQGVAFIRALRRKGYSGPLVGGDALHESPDFITQLGKAAAMSYASETAIDSAATSKSFRLAYRRRFHTPLQIYDAFAYDAANINLYAIYMAATHGTFRGTLFQKRASVLPYVAHVRWHGVTGITSFDRNGDTRHPIISMYAVRSGKWVFVGVAPKVTGVSPTG